MPLKSCLLFAVGAISESRPSVCSNVAARVVLNGQIRICDSGKNPTYNNIRLWTERVKPNARVSRVASLLGFTMLVEFMSTNKRRNVRGTLGVYWSVPFNPTHEISRLPDDTHVVATYVKYRTGPEKQSVVRVRLKLEEIDAKAEGAGG